MELLPAWALLKWHGTALFVWLALLPLFLTTYSISYVFGRLVDALLGFALRHRKETHQTIRVLLHPMELLLALALFNAGKQFFPFSKQLRIYTDLGALFISTFAIAWLFFGLSGVLIERLERHFQRHNRRAALAILPLLRRFLRITVAVLAVLFLLQNLHFNVAALLAGLGVGGIAIALASQKSMENLFGGIMVILDQPVRVGDYCRFGENKTGTVEDVGLRSTRIRTPEHTLVSIPNSEFSQMQLENYAHRKKILFKTLINLRYETTSTQLRAIQSRILALLDASGDVDKTRSVHLINFGEYALQLELNAFVLTRDNERFAELREAWLLAIIDIIRSEGSDLAYPTQSVQVLATKKSVATEMD